jgi:hypothetical protein
LCEGLFLLTTIPEVHRIILRSLLSVVGVAQLVERLTVAQAVAGSSPVAHPIILTGSSAAWLAHLLWEQGAVGSNPTFPTSLSRYF